jgi:hypothetical protein
MKKDDASLFKGQALNAIRELTSALSAVQNTCDEGETLIIRRSIGDIVARIDGLLAEAVYAKFPELDDLKDHLRSDTSAT